MGNWYSAHTTSGYRNALDENMMNGTATFKKQGAVKKPAVISALLKAIDDNNVTELKNRLEELKTNRPVSSNTKKSVEVLYAAYTRGSVTVINLFTEYYYMFDWKAKWGNSYPLLEAARRKHIAIFATLFRDRCFDDYKNVFASMADDVERNTLLHIAADAQEDVILQFSLDCGADPTVKNGKGMTPLHYVAMRGNLKACKLLLDSLGSKHHAILSYIRSEADNVCKETAVYFAAKHNHKDMLKFLLQRYHMSGGKEKELIEKCTELGFTPLLAAVRYNNPECVAVLLAKKANILSCDNPEKARGLNALLWAVVVQSPTIVKLILKHAERDSDITLCKKIWSSTDPKGNTAHHLAAETQNYEILQILVGVNTSCLETNNEHKLTPLHIAARCGTVKMVIDLINNAPSTAYSKDNQGNSVLHIAAEMGNMALVKSLVQMHNFGLLTCTRNISSGKTPLHLAAEGGHDTVLRFLVDHPQTPADAIDILDNNNHTALYLACNKGHELCVDILLKKGAKITYSCSGSVVNGGKLQSCFMTAIMEKHRPVVKMILESKDWRQALRFCMIRDDYSDADDPNEGMGYKQCSILHVCLDPQVSANTACKETTPFRELIKEMPELAKLVLDKCSTANLPKWTYEYECEFVEDFQNLYSNKERSTFGSASDGEFPAEKLPGSVAHHEPVAAPVPKETYWGPEKYYFWNHPLQLMVISKRDQLLKHHLVKSFIQRKWLRFGAPVFYSNIVIYGLLMILLTVYMHIHLDLVTKVNDASLTNRCNSSGIDTPKDDVNSGKAAAYIITLKVMAALIVTICIMRIIVELSQLFIYSGEYLTSWVNLIEGFLYFGTIVFVLSDYEFCELINWRWQLGALCIFLSWINFVLFLSKEPTFGIYVIMLQVMIKTFLKTVPMTVLLILAFGQPFYMLLSPSIVRNEDGKELSTSPFASQEYSLMKTVTMTIGEFDEVDHILYHNPPNILHFGFATYFLWLIFVVVMAVLLQNLLTGLAVGDVGEVREVAALEKEALQIEFLLKLTNLRPVQMLMKRYNHTKKEHLYFLSGKRFRTKLAKFSICRANKDTEDNQFLHMKPKGFHDSREQQFQDLVERCERIEKMILKMGDEHRYYCQNCNEMIRFSGHSAPELGLDPRQSQYLNQETELENEAVIQPSRLAVTFESQV